MKIEGVVDRSVRVVVSLILLSLIFVGPQTLWGVIGLVIGLAGGLGISMIRNS